MIYTKKIFTLLIIIFSLYSNNPLIANNSTSSNNFHGMWTLSISDGSVGWLHVHDNDGYLDAELLWKGGSVFPVSHVYLVGANNLVVTRTQKVNKSKVEGNERSHTITHTLNIRRHGDQLSGEFISPDRSGNGVKIESFKGSKLPEMNAAPDLSSVKFGKPIQLFNGKNLDGWEIIRKDRNNGFKVENGILMNDPVQDEGHTLRYGNLRTTSKFEDFNLKLEVNVPTGNNSGIYLKGMYEIQVFDSYGKELDSHHMGAVYSRVTPTKAAEKPGGEWQSVDITLCKRHITVVLNGVKIIDNQPVHGPTGGAIIADVFAPGPIYLQGDHGKVSYKNIVLTPIID